MTKYLTILNYNIGEVNIYKLDENQYDFYMGDEETFIKEVIGLNYDEVSTMISDEEPFITKEKLVTKIKNYSHSQAFKLYRKKVNELNNLLKNNEDLKSIRRAYMRELKRNLGYESLKVDQVYILGMTIERNLVDIKVLNNQCKILKHKVIQADKKYKNYESYI